MRKIADFVYGMTLAGALLVLAAGAVGSSVILAHVLIFGVQGR